MQDPQTHCTPHLDSESEWEMLCVGVSEALSHPTARAPLGCLSEMGVQSPCCRQGLHWDWNLCSVCLLNTCYFSQCSVE